MTERRQTGLAQSGAAQHALGGSAETLAACILCSSPRPHTLLLLLSLLSERARSRAREGKRERERERAHAREGGRERTMNHFSRYTPPVSPRPLCDARARGLGAQACAQIWARARAHKHIHTHHTHTHTHTHAHTHTHTLTGHMRQRQDFVAQVNFAHSIRPLFPLVH